MLKDLSRLVPLHQRYVSIVREVAREEEAVLCDLARRFEALPHRDVAEKYFGLDGIHPTEEGNRLIAQYLYECFEENRLLERIAP